ncbi:MAG: exodeoxyribonuclease III [Bacteroidales bacterium]|nr:exodeoxyribonuclease III [Bacteroidales bacterium]
MRILSWNLNGLKASLRRGDFEQLKALPALDVISLQEIRTHECPTVLEGYRHYWYPAMQKGYSGTLTMSLVEPVDVIYGFGNSDLDKEGRVLCLDFGSLYVVNTYAPKSQGDPEREEYRRKWDAAYREHLIRLSEEKPVIACGDLNVTLDRKDIYAENTRMSFAELGYMSDERASLMQLFESGFVDAFRYVYPDAEEAFTWWSNRRNKRKEGRGWRLDYFIVHDAIKDRIVDVMIHGEIKGSDHCPLVLDCDWGNEAYAQKYAEAVCLKEEREREDKRLENMWRARKRFFHSYRDKLKEIQSKITMHSYLHENDEVKRLQEEILDDLRFRCLAVWHVAKNSSSSGVDGVRWRTDAELMRAAINLEWRGYKASPRRMVEIKDKRSGKKRRSGILTWKDKAMSTLMGYTFSPIEEASAD